MSPSKSEEMSEAEKRTIEPCSACGWTCTFLGDLSQRKEGEGFAVICALCGNKGLPGKNYTEALELWNKGEPMHAMSFQIEGYGEVIVNKNSDWSGAVKIRYRENGDLRTVELPGELLIGLAKECAADRVREDIIRYLETWP